MGRVNQCNAKSCFFDLNQGVETSIVFKRLIAQYLDIPTGKRLTLLRRAYSNLSEAMKDWHGRL